MLLAASGCIQYTSLNEAIHYRAVLERKHEVVFGGRYTVQPPDMIKVAVPGQDPQTVRIQPDGYASISGAGTLYLAGLTPEEAEKVISDALVGLRAPSATVSVVGFNSRRVYVFGEVGSSGAMAFQGNFSVVDALSMAGGVARTASPANARLIRYTDEGPQVFRIDFKAIARQGDDASNLLMRDGDILYVPPTVMVKAGYAIENFMFPVRSVMNSLFSFLNFAGGNTGL